MRGQKLEGSQAWAAQCRTVLEHQLLLLLRGSNTAGCQDQPLCQLLGVHRALLLLLLLLGSKVSLHVSLTWGPRMQLQRGIGDALLPLFAPLPEAGHAALPYGAQAAGLAHPLGLHMAPGGQAGPGGGAAAGCGLRCRGALGAPVEQR